jgi:hypothetical protein
VDVQVAALSGSTGSRSPTSLALEVLRVHRPGRARAQAGGGRLHQVPLSPASSIADCNARTVTRIFTEDLLTDLCARDDRPWREWRNGNRLTAIREPESRFPLLLALIVGR